jgi:ABC-type transporter Mla maintaining outer membrane lipid asymmetry permease subunit MlaE
MLAGLGRVALFTGAVVGHLARPPFYWREIGQQLIAIGWLSLPVVGLTALFTGGAPAWVFLAAMFAGMAAARWLARPSAAPGLAPSQT